MSDALRIRAARRSDTECLVELVRQFRSFLEAAEPTEEDVRRRLPEVLADTNALLLLAESVEAEPLGYLQLRIRASLWYGPDAEIEDLFVADAARGAGVGRALLREAIERARGRGCRHLGVNTNERNVAALALYAAHGLDGRRARWQGGRQIWMDRELG